MSCECKYPEVSYLQGEKSDSYLKARSKYKDRINGVLQFSGNDGVCSLDDDTMKEQILEHVRESFQDSVTENGRLDISITSVEENGQDLICQVSVMDAPDYQKIKAKISEEYRTQTGRKAKNNYISELIVVFSNSEIRQVIQKGPSFEDKVKKVLSELATHVNSENTGLQDIIVQYREDDNWSPETMSLFIQELFQILRNYEDKYDHDFIHGMNSIITILDAVYLLIADENGEKVDNGELLSAYKKTATLVLSLDGDHNVGGSLIFLRMKLEKLG